jgi:hypothetical protein
MATGLQCFNHPPPNRYLVKNTFRCIPGRNINAYRFLIEILEYERTLVTLGIHVLIICNFILNRRGDLNWAYLSQEPF